jgi:putative cytotoxic protein
LTLLTTIIYTLLWPYVHDLASCILDDSEFLGFVHGQQRWTTDQGKRVYTWDSLHGEVEVFNGRGKHLGVKHAISEDWIKEAVPGTSIDV